MYLQLAESRKREREFVSIESPLDDASASGITRASGCRSFQSTKGENREEEDDDTECLVGLATIGNKKELEGH